MTLLFYPAWEDEEGNKTLFVNIHASSQEEAEKWQTENAYFFKRGGLKPAGIKILDDGCHFLGVAGFIAGLGRCFCFEGPLLIRTVQAEMKEGTLQ